MRNFRYGTLLARDVIARRRARPKNMTPIGLGYKLPLWEKAYHDEFSRAVRDGRIKPPRGGSGVSR